MDTTPDPTTMEQAIERLNGRASVALENARLEAVALGQPYVGCHHLLLGLATDSDSVAARVLRTIEASPDVLRERVRFISGSGPGGDGDPSGLPLSPRLAHVLVAAGHDALRRGHDEIGTIHLLAAIAKERVGIAVAVLERPGLGLEPLGREILAAIRGGWID